MSLLSSQIEAQWAQFQKQFGEPVTYNNVAVDIAIDLACPRPIKADDTHVYDQHTLTFGRTWDIGVLDLAVSNVAFAPAAGHTITDENDEVWEVVPDPVTNRIWEWPSVGRHKRKVFTLKKGT